MTPRRIPSRAMSKQVADLQRRASSGVDEFDQARTALPSVLRWIVEGDTPSSEPRVRDMILAIAIALEGADLLPDEPHRLELAELEIAFTRGLRTREPRYLGPEFDPPAPDPLPAAWEPIAKAIEDLSVEHPAPAVVVPEDGGDGTPDPRWL